METANDANHDIRTLDVRARTIVRDLVWQIYLICEHGAVDLMTGAMAFPVRAAGESPAQMQPMSTMMEIPKGWAAIIEESERRAAEIERLRLRNAALVEIVKEGRCPVDGRHSVAECQQCGCSLGILTANEQNEND